MGNASENIKKISGKKSPRLTLLGNSDTINTTQSFSLMRYVLFDDHFDEVGTYDSIYELRKFLCDRKYELDCDKDIGDTFDYIKHIKWHFDIKQD
jgi:hypothetical protein|tara:strand:- start:82 stop:366 length:285 start_codon:yes stop_codon:yes gene_type:complete